MKTIILSAILLTGCRCNVAVSLGKPAVAVQVSPQNWDGNSLDGTLEATGVRP